MDHKNNLNEITLQKLILMLPFEEKVRDALLGKLDTLTPDQRFGLTDLCWEMYGELCRVQEEYDTDKAILEMAKGGKGYTKQNFEDIRKHVVDKFTQKLVSAEEMQKLEEIRNQLHSQKVPPKGQSQVSSMQSFPSGKNYSTS